MIESGLERKFVEFVHKNHGLALKWVSPGVTGVPDRICIFPGGKVIFVELKRPGRADGRSARQKKMFRVLEGLGCKVWLVNDLDTFKRRLTEEQILEI